MKSDTHTVTLIIPSQRGYEKTAMYLVQCLATDMGLSFKKVQRLKTALAEACLNAMEHGNRFQNGLDVTIQFIQHPSKLEITVQDSGVGGHISLPTEDPNIDVKVSGSSKKRGWGIFLIKNLVDEAQFETLPKGGSIVRIISYLKPVSKHANVG